MALALVHKDHARITTPPSSVFGRQCAASLHLDAAAQALFAADLARVGVPDIATTADVARAWASLSPLVADLYRRQAQLALARLDSSAVLTAKFALGQRHFASAIDAIEAFDEALTEALTSSPTTGATRP